MDTTPRVSPQQFADGMKQEMEQYLKAVQQRIDAAEAAFPPSGRSTDGKAIGQ